MQQALPRFIAIGPPRTATTWIYHVLQGEVGLPTSPFKEPCFFDKNFHRGLRWYNARFCPVPGRAAGEISPTYFYSDPARERIRSLLPRCQIICTLRDPVERVYSLYKLRRAYGLVQSDFESAVGSDAELIESSRYGHYLERWLRSFGESAVLVLFHEALRRDPQEYLDTICDFIGIPRFKYTNNVGANQRLHSDANWEIPRSNRLARMVPKISYVFYRAGLEGLVALAKASRLRKALLGGGGRFERLDAHLECKLRKRYRGEVERVEGLLHVDLSAWKYGAHR